MVENDIHDDSNFLINEVVIFIYYLNHQVVKLLISFIHFILEENR